MDDQMEMLLSKIKFEMKKQTTTLTESITTAILKQMEDKLKPIIEENRYLKDEVEKLNNKIKYMEIRKKENNLIFYGYEESGKNENTLELITTSLSDSGVEIFKQDINKAFRIGKEQGKARPILVNMLNSWKKIEILRNKKQLPKNIFVKEDFTKEMLEKRKELLPKLKEERSKGRIAYIKHDKLIIKEETSTVRDKRKREQSASPKIASGAGNSKPKINKINAFEHMYRNRSHSTSELNKE